MPPPHSAEEAQSLFRGPPAYDEVRALEELEVEEAAEAADPGSVSWFGRMTRFGKTRIFVPVRHVIDPIAHAWHAVGLWIDRLIGRWVNPLLAKRILFMVFILCVVFLIYFLHSDRLMSTGYGHFDHAGLRERLLDAISAESLRDRTTYFGQMPHYAGSVGDATTRKFVLDSLANAGLHPKLDRHDVYLSHGNETLCELRLGDDVVYSSPLREDEALESPSVSQQQPRAQMALVWPGDAEGALVYVHEGTVEDVDAVLAGGVDLDGKVALVQYSVQQPGAVAVRLEAHGVRAVLFFAPPAPAPWQPWPDGPALPAGGIQQRSLGISTLYPGDVLSPGWPSSMQLRVLKEAAYIPHIPAAALAWRDAEPMLRALDGCGVQRAEWAADGVAGWVGPAVHTVRLRTSPIVEDRHQIANVIGSMKGHEASGTTVVVGARMDAMCYGASQLSGLAVLLEVAHAFATVRYDEQWQPLRSILFVAWDGTSQNYAGATEWVESVSESLAKEGVAYIDLDMGVAGPDFVAQGNPIFPFDDLYKGVALNDSCSVYDALDFGASNFPVPGFGNHLAFEAHTGVPTLKLGFAGYPAPTDSCFDSVEWMEKFGDPDMQRHLALARVVAQVLLELSDAPLIPFDFPHVGAELERYLVDLEEETLALIDEQDARRAPFIDALHEAKVHAKQLAYAGDIYTTIRRQWADYAAENRDPGTGKLVESPPVAGLRMFWNEKVNNVCKAFLDRNGIEGRNWYKNHVFGPAALNYANEKLRGTFPAVRDALRQRDAEKALETLHDAIEHVDKATRYLEAMRL